MLLIDIFDIQTDTLKLYNSKSNRMQKKSLKPTDIIAIH